MAINVNTPVYQEFVEYLAEIATPEQILAFKVSEAMQERADDLLDRNNEGELTLEERSELEQIRQFNRVVSLLKARAALTLKSR